MAEAKKEERSADVVDPAAFSECHHIWSRHPRQLGNQCFQWARCTKSRLLGFGRRA